jgi:ABC-type sulfate/molybdate transport systems ATPase subunit
MLHISATKRLREFTFDVTADIPNGVTVIVGPSGSGKTTLLRLVAGLLRPDSGTITLNGRVLADAHTFVPAYERNIGVVFQEYALFPHLTVGENVAFGLRARSVSASERATRVRGALERLEIGALGNERTGDLSGGQRQRVALARALIIGPAALLLDEPLSALDPQTRGRVRAELAAVLAGIDIPTLLVTHDESDRAAFPDRAMHLERGRLTLDPATEAAR